MDVFDGLDVISDHPAVTGYTFFITLEYLSGDMFQFVHALELLLFWKTKCHKQPALIFFMN